MSPIVLELSQSVRKRLTVTDKLVSVTVVPSVFVNVAVIVIVTGLTETCVSSAGRREIVGEEYVTQSRDSMVGLNVIVTGFVQSTP